jgi:hypothetical protein
MNRLLVAVVALSALLGTAGVTFAQGVSPSPYGAGPGYGQPMAPPSAGASQPYAWQSSQEIDGTHTAGTGNRAYRWGQKTN